MVLARDGRWLAAAPDGSGSPRWSVQRVSSDEEQRAVTAAAVDFDGDTLWSFDKATASLTGVDLATPGATPRVVSTGLTGCGATTLTVRGHWALVGCFTEYTLVDLGGEHPAWRLPSDKTVNATPQLGHGFVAFPRYAAGDKPGPTVAPHLFLADAATHDLRGSPVCSASIRTRRSPSTRPPRPASPTSTRTGVSGSRT